ASPPSVLNSCESSASRIDTCWSNSGTCCGVSPGRSSATWKTVSASPSNANADGSAQALDRRLDELRPGTDRQHRRPGLRLRLSVHGNIAALWVIQRSTL